jgi:hypothetical protein
MDVVEGLNLLVLEERVIETFGRSLENRVKKSKLNFEEIFRKELISFLNISIKDSLRYFKDCTKNISMSADMKQNYYDAIACQLAHVSVNRYYNSL